MGLWDRLGNLFEKRQLTSSQLFSLIADGAPTYAGPAVNEESAMRSGAVYACIRIISESIAALPLVLYRTNGRNKERATTHPLYPVLHDLANPDMTALEWRELMIAHCLLRGNGWSEIQYDTMSRIVALWPLNPANIDGYERRGGEMFWLYRLPGGERRAISAQRIHHIKGLGDGYMGNSPILQAARQAIGLSLAAEEFGARFYSNGARPGLILRHPGKLSPGAHERLRASFATEHQGLSNSHRTKILEEGMDISTIGIPPNEAQFLETRKFQVTEIARIYRVPPHMLADLDRATFSNIEHQSLSFVTQTLMPWFVRHEQAIYRDLLTVPERKSYFAKYVVAGMLRGDTATRYQAYTTGISTGFLTRNEARELEDLNPLEGLDEPLLPLNMMEVGDTPDTQPEPVPEQEPRHDHADLEMRAEVSDPAVWDERAEATRRNRQAMMNRSVRLWEDAATRMIKREVADVRKATARHLGSRSDDSFETWLAKFYEQMRSWMPDYYRALMLTYAEEIMSAIAGELGGEPAPLDDDLRAWIEAYLVNFANSYTVGSEKQMRSVVLDATDDEADAEAKVNERLDGWQDTQPGKLALEQAFEAGNALSIYGYVAGGVEFLRWSANSDACPLCKKLDGRRIPINGAFVDAGDTVKADGVDPLPVARAMKHGPLHSGCSCNVVRG